MSTTTTRADQLLVKSGLARSRTEAQRLIEAQMVTVNDTTGKPMRVKPSTRLPANVSFALTGEPEQFASRGALKLQGAFDAFDVSAANRICLDAGQSTGGFTDFLLRADASAVVGIDVGHGQLDSDLRSDARVLCVERFNLRDASRDTIKQQLLLADSKMPEPTRRTLAADMHRDGFALIVADLSFISVRKVMPTMSTLLSANGDMVVLVKPQFELGPGAVNRRGIVRDPAAGQGLKDVFSEHAKGLGLTMNGWIPSPVTGGDGNQEFLAHFNQLDRPAKNLKG